MPRKAMLPALALLAAAALAQPAYALVNNPDGTKSLGEQPAAGAAPGALPTAGQVKDAAKAAEERENSASKSVEDMLRRAQESTRSPSPASGEGTSRRSGKAIYGDIIIHK